MKTSLSFVSVIGIAVVMMVSCGKDSNPNSSGPAVIDTNKVIDTPKVLDSTVAGEWEGAIPPLKFTGLIDFNGVLIFVDISKADSSFAIVGRDTSRDIMKNPAIKDTSLFMAGAWKLNAPQDSILLICDTARVIDTALNILVPRDVRGQIIPLAVNISKNTNGEFEWKIAMNELLPLAPLLGLDLSNFGFLLQAVKIVLIKRRQ